VKANQSYKLRSSGLPRIFLMRLLFIASMLSPVFATAQLADPPAPAKDAQSKYLSTPFTINKFDRLSLKRFDRKEWQEARKSLQYNETPPEKTKDVETKENQPNPLFSGQSLFSGAAFKYIFSGIAILLLAFILFRLIAGRLNNKSIKRGKVIVTVEDIEDISHVTEPELDRLLRLALESGNFREAVRIYYVSIIRRLSENELIRWQKDKTNREYLSELSHSSHYPLFREITLLFDRVWYGDIHLDESAYLRMSPRFKTLSDALKTERGGEK
jgi:hypothetical protein